VSKQVRFVEVAALPESDEGVLLALLNTTPTVAGERRDELAEESSARAWLATNVEDAPETTDFAQLRETRAALQRVVVGEAAPTVLSDALAGVQVIPMLTDDGISWALRAPARTVVAARAVLAWDWIRANLPGRLRPCANPDCTLFFVDRSRNNGARWCSMTTCGNRMKARRHYARSKSDRLLE
jgi:predicted RNA-binding Zn ribbon-like protein